MTAKTAGKPAKESEHQASLIRWAQLQRGKYPELALLFHIPNGGTRDPVEAAHLKAQGVKKGVSDLFLPVARRGYHGLFIEMKRPHGRVSPEQQLFGDNVTRQGYLFHVAYGWEAAREALEWYLGGAERERPLRQSKAPHGVRA